MDLRDYNNLNRLGIILNFAAGFLLAPELLGRRNLERGERWLKSAEALINRILATFTGGGDITNSKAHRLAKLLIYFTTLFSLAFWWFVWRTEQTVWKTVPQILFVLLITQVIWVLWPSFRSSSAAKFEKRFRLLRWPLFVQSFLIMTAVLFTWSISSIVVILVAIPVVYSVVTPSIAKDVLDPEVELFDRARLIVFLMFFFSAQLAYVYVVSALAAVILLGRLSLEVMSPDRQSLRVRLVVIGIVFFIVGNAFQLASTLVSSPVCEACISD